VGASGPATFYYIGPQFRRERPQKGRYRQFYTDWRGSDWAERCRQRIAGSRCRTPGMLATLLETAWAFRVGSLKLNSVGCANDRPIYLQALRDALKDVVLTMCSDCQRRAETNPLRVLDCKVPADQPIIEKLPRNERLPG